MDIVIVVVGAAVIGVIIYLAVVYLKKTDRRQVAPPSDRERLMAERDGVFAALRDLEADHGAGKLTADEFAEQRAAQMARGAEILRRLDELAVNEAPDPLEAAIAARRRQARPTAQVNGVRPTPPADDELEAAIHARRRPAPQSATQAVAPLVAAALATRACSGCGADVDPDDRFCGACGRAQPQSRVCSHCAEPAGPDDRFCGRCGARLTEATGSA